MKVRVNSELDIEILKYDYLAEIERREKIRKEMEKCWDKVEMRYDFENKN